MERGKDPYREQVLTRASIKGAVSSNNLESMLESHVELGSGQIKDTYIGLGLKQQLTHCRTTEM